MNTNNTKKFSSNPTKDKMNVHYRHKHKPTLMLLRQIIAVDCTNGIMHLWGSFECSRMLYCCNIVTYCYCRDIGTMRSAVV